MSLIPDVFSRPLVAGGVAGDVLIEDDEDESVEESKDASGHDHDAKGRFGKGGGTTGARSDRKHVSFHARGGEKADVPLYSHGDAKEHPKAAEMLAAVKAAENHPSHRSGSLPMKAAYAAAKSVDADLSLEDFHRQLLHWQQGDRLALKSNNDTSLISADDLKHGLSTKSASGYETHKSWLNTLESVQESKDASGHDHDAQGRFGKGGGAGKSKGNPDEPAADSPDFGPAAKKPGHGEAHRARRPRRQGEGDGEALLPQYRDPPGRRDPGRQRLRPDQLRQDAGGRNPGRARAGRYQRRLKGLAWAWTKVKAKVAGYSGEAAEGAPDTAAQVEAVLEVVKLLHEMMGFAEGDVPLPSAEEIEAALAKRSQS